MESNTNINTNNEVSTKEKKVVKAKKTIDEKIAETNALLKELRAQKKLGVSSKKKLTVKSKGVSELLDALKVVTTENKATVSDVLKLIAVNKKVKVTFE